MGGTYTYMGPTLCETALQTIELMQNFLSMIRSFVCFTGEKFGVIKSKNRSLEFDVLKIISMIIQNLITSLSFSFFYDGFHSRDLYL